ncbi:MULTISPECIES: MBL fold metallo-hydrolase [Aeromonas]|uniref:MBL fold metallo-hydrolase n=2 Tax=Aeromonadaceae TaxID=84642 RepID=UPI000399D95F|nr:MULTISPECIES: MBL fold metallo-hydrolase [Aeromonas]MCR3959511.1 MBL fold metallo-hydrolase [Aeromonas veronii]NJI19389.1 hypothetical protein [Aeromonas veronii]WAF71044.1 MBL fold metallo-hydrolase [Aeromonas dhakensis]
MIKIKMYPACQGDAFLLSIDNESTNIIIDMGLKATYSNHIRSDLMGLKRRGHSIDLLVVTHVDNDHIEGVVKFIEENGENCSVIDVKEVWHNSYRHLQLNKNDIELEAEEVSILKQICDQNRNLSQVTGLQDIGIKEGVTLAGLLYGYNYHWNEKLNGNVVAKQHETIKISQDVFIRLISPDAKKNNALAQKWKEKLESEMYGFTLNDEKIFDDAFEQYMKTSDFNSELRDVSVNESQYSYEELVNLTGIDKSVTNGSSIAFIIEYKNYKLLFLGDAHEDNIYHELLSLKNIGYKLEFDIVKLSHHGSNNNISSRLLELISSKRYLISTNGRHSHPDLGTIAKILKANSDAEIITNYHHEKLNIFKSIVESKKLKAKFILASEIIVE